MTSTQVLPLPVASGPIVSYVSGYLAGLLLAGGEPVICPYRQGTENAEHWDRGCGHAQGTAWLIRKRRAGA